MRSDIIWATFCAVVLVGVGRGAEYMLTADGGVGANLSALPSDLAFSGSGTSASPYIYDLGTDALNMSVYQVTSATYYATFKLSSLSYDSGGANGGIFYFKGPGNRGNLSIESLGTISIRSIDTSSTSRIGNNDRAGYITLQAVNGITVAETLLATQTGNEQPANIFVWASNGPVAVGGLIDTGRSRRPGTVTVTGESLALHDIWAGASSSSLTCYGAKVALTSTLGAVRVDGSINNWSGAEAAGGGDIVITGATDVVITGGITNRTYRTADAGTKGGGNVSISAGNDVAIKGGIHSGVSYVGALPGNLTLSSTAGSIELADLDVSLHNNISLTAAKGTVIDGAVLGLESALDAQAMTVGRFTAVTGNIYYNPKVTANAYLGEKSYMITVSVGGTYSLRPYPQAGTSVFIF